MFVHIYVFFYLYVLFHTFFNVHICVYLFTVFECMIYILYIYIYIYVYIYIYMYIYVYIYVYIYMYLFIYMIIYMSELFHSVSMVITYSGCLGYSVMCRRSSHIVVFGFCFRRFDVFLNCLSIFDVSMFSGFYVSMFLCEFLSGSQLFIPAKGHWVRDRRTMGYQSCKMMGPQNHHVMWFPCISNDPRVV